MLSGSDYNPYVTAKMVTLIRSFINRLHLSVWSQAAEVSSKLQTEIQFITVHFCTYIEMPLKMHHVTLASILLYYSFSFLLAFCKGFCLEKMVYKFSLTVLFLSDKFITLGQQTSWTDFVSVFLSNSNSRQAEDSSLATATCCQIKSNTYRPTFEDLSEAVL